MWALKVSVDVCDPSYQRGAHTPLCGHAYWCSSLTAQIVFIEKECVYVRLGGWALGKTLLNSSL